MFWFLAVYICIFEDFWYLWLILVCPNLKKSKPARPLIFMGLLCKGFGMHALSWAYWEGDVHAGPNHWHLMDSCSHTSDYVKCLWPSLSGHLQPWTCFLPTPLVGPSCPPHHDLCPAPWPGWVGVGVTGQAVAASSSGPYRRSCEMF